MISIKPDVLITIAWCVYGIIMNTLPIQLNYFREISFILIILLSKRKMKLRNMHFICLIFCAYYYVISLAHEGLISSFESSVSMISWALTLVVFTAYEKDENDIRILFEFIIYSSLFVSVIYILNNDLFSNNLIVSLNNGNEVNRNAIIYYILPGYIFQLLKLERSKHKRIIDYIIIAIMLFVCIQINSRAMYLSLLFTSLLMFNKQIISLVKRGKIFGVIIFILLICFAVYEIFTILPDEYITRQLSGRFIESDTGRMELWKEAIGMVDNPLFGMGPSFYSKNVSYAFADYGAHNIFVDLYVATGILSVLLFLVVLTFFYNRNLYIITIIFPAYLSFFVEAGRTFFPYMLLVISWFIVLGAKKEKISIDDFLYNVFNKER